MTSSDSRKRSAERTKIENEDNDLSTPGPIGSGQGSWPKPPPGLLSTSETPLELLQQETSRVQTLEEYQAKVTVAPPA